MPEASKSTLGLDGRLVIASLMREHGDTGVQTHVNELRRFLASQTWDVRFINPFFNAKALVYPVFAMRKLIDPLSASASIWWYRHWHFYFLRRALRRELIHSAPGAIYSQCPLSSLAAIQARRNCEQRVVTAIHFNISQADEWAEKGMLSPRSAHFHSIRQLEAKVLPKVDGLVYVSNFARKQLEARIPALRKVRSEVIPNFLNMPEIPSDIAPDPNRIVTIGSLEPRKNQTFLLRILAEARNRGRTLHLDIIGDGPDRRKLQSLAEQLHIQDQIRFLGYQRNAIKLLPRYAAYVHAAKMESFAFVLVEAMACGLPLLAAPVGGVPEVFRDGCQGYYWDLNDESGAAEKLINILVDQTLRKELGANALSHFHNHLRAEIVAPRLCKLLAIET